MNIEFSKKFVCATKEYCTVANHVSAPAFRKSFKLPQKAEKAEILICGLGFYDLFLNGKKITKGFLAPYISNPDDIIYYDHYDIADKLSVGENVIGVVLGNGMNNPMTVTWNFFEAIYTSSPKFALSFSAEYGEEKIEFDATAFKCNNSPITFDNLRYGVRYDARLEKKGWCLPEFDDSDWQTSMAAETPRGYAKLCEAEPVVITEELSPVSFCAGKLADYKARIDVNDHVLFDGVNLDIPERSGGYIYDFGKNTAGVFRFKIKNAKPGQKISFQCGEYLDNDGKLSYQNIKFFPDGYVQRDIYICKGDEEEIFVPMFTYHGFRYIYVHGINEAQANAEALTMLVMSSDIKLRADFECSDSIANKLWDAIINSDLSNFYYFPTDCPHREKNGWTGDAAASAEHMIMTLTPENSWREWLSNIRAAQNADGAIPGIVPTSGWGFEWGNGPAWDRVLFDLPFMAYIYRGNTDIIKENRHAMMRYLEYVSNRRRDDGLVEIGLGDWAPIKHGSYTTPLYFTDSVMVYDICAKAEKMFLAIGNNLNADFAHKLGAEIKTAIRQKLISFENMTVKCMTQTAQAMAVYYDIFDAGEKAEAVKQLVNIIRMSGDNVEGGYLGLRVIFHVLADGGESELAYHMIMKPSYPSYAYYINQGFTSLPEMLAREVKDCESLNHHFFGDINHWFLRHIVGLNVNPAENNPNKILVKPHFISELDFARGSYSAPLGKVSISWERDGKSIKLSVTADKDIVCDIELPRGYRFDGEKSWCNCQEKANGEFTVIPFENFY